MKTINTIRVALLANEFNAAQIMLAATQTSRGLDINRARSPKEFLSALHDADVIVVESSGLEGLVLGEVIERAAASPGSIPVVVLGRDNEDGDDAIQLLEEGAADYLPVSHISRLPLVVWRVCREREMLRQQSRSEQDLRNACNALLKNQKLMAIGRLTGSIAHEINNPLESITNLLYLLKNEPNRSANDHHYLALAEREMERVARISKQTLSFYRETNTPVWVKPSDLLEEVVGLYSRKLEERRIEVIRQYRTDASLLIFPGEMRQVLSNLITNAIEASAEGGRLILRVRRSRQWFDDGICGIRIVIADNGSGINAETRKHLGQLFYTTKGQRGTGLGLWVTQAVVKRYGGVIQIYSSTRERLHGTVFNIFIPTNLRPQAVIPEGNLAVPETHFGYGQQRSLGKTLKSSATSMERGSGNGLGDETGNVRRFRKNREPRVAS